MNTISLINDLSEWNEHHMLSQRFGGSNHKHNRKRINIRVHDEYNRITKGGAIPSIRFCAHHLIRSLEHAPYIIGDDGVNEILQTLTPVDWRKCYQPDAIAVQTKSQDYSDPNTFFMAQHWLDCMDHEDYLIRRTLGGLLRTKRGTIRNTILMESMHFFEVTEPMDVIEKYFSTDELCGNLQRDVKRKVLHVARTEKPKVRTEKREKQIIEVLRRQRQLLHAFERIWYPVDKYDILLSAAVSQRYNGK